MKMCWMFHLAQRLRTKVYQKLGP